MATSSNFTLFTNDSGSASGPTSYVQDEFPDVTLPATSNGTLTSSATTNPWGLNWGNDDVPKYGPKTLWIKDFVLITDRSKWINNRPTYQVIWNENFPAVQAYISGDAQLITSQFDQRGAWIKLPSDLFGLMGVVRRVQFIVNDSTNASATGQITVDGVAGNTIDFSGASSDSYTTRNNKFSAFVHAAANASYDLHHYQLNPVQGQAQGLQIVGVVVYFENATNNVDLFPGVSYVNKSRITTTVGSSLGVPALGSSLGGVATIYKTQSNSYAYSNLGTTMIQSLGVGTNGTGTVNVSTGTGSSFPIGSGVIGVFGTSAYVGSVTAVSTDALTVTPNLYIGVSGLFYKTWQSGPTYAINASFNILSQTIGYTAFGGFSNVYLEPQGNYYIFGSNVGVTDMTGVLGITLASSAFTKCMTFAGASGFLQVDGYFSAAEVEFIGSAYGAVNGVLAATFSVNGVPSYSQNQGATSIFKQTVFTDAGPGWNSFNIAPSASFAGMAISKINLYTKSKDNGVTYGLLGSLEALQTQTQRSALNASLMTLGTYRRYHSDQMYFKGHYVKTLGASFAGGAMYVGASSNSSMRLEFFGKSWAILGTAGTGTTVTIDGVGVASPFNALQSVATEGFHTVLVTQAASTTTVIQALDVMRTYGEMKNYQTIAPNQVFTLTTQSPELPAEIRVNGATTTSGNFITHFANTTKLVGSMMWVSDTALGDSATITEPGLYSIYYQDNFDSLTNAIGISVNSTQLSTSPATANGVIIFTFMNVVQKAIAVTVPSIYLNKGDVVRAHADQTTRGAGSNTYFFITKLRSF